LVPVYAVPFVIETASFNAKEANQLKIVVDNSDIHELASKKSSGQFRPTSRIYSANFSFPLV
jgi:hypothetical protein